MYGTASYMCSLAPYLLLSLSETVVEQCATIQNFSFHTKRIHYTLCIVAGRHEEEGLSVKISSSLTCNEAKTCGSMNC